MSTEDTRVERSWRLNVPRALRMSLLISLAAHLFFLAWVFFLGSSTPSLSIEFEPSEGVAILPPSDMSAYADMPRADEQVDDVDEAAEDEQADDVDEAAEDEQADDVDEAAEDEQADDVDEAAEDEQADDVDEAAEDEQAGERDEDAEEVADVSEPELRQADAPADENEATAPEEPEPVAEPEDAHEEEQAAETEEDSPSRRHPEGSLHPVATDVSMWGPESARLVVVMRNDRVRSSPWRDAVESVLSALPDWNLLVGEAQLDPIEDVDATLIASSDPRWIDRTFLAAVHRMPPDELLRSLGRNVRGGVQWETRAGTIVGSPAQSGRFVDPRLFVVPHPELFVFSRPEYVDDLISGGRADFDGDSVIAASESAADSDAEAAADAESNGAAPGEEESDDAGASEYADEAESGDDADASDDAGASEYADEAESGDDAGAVDDVVRGGGAPPVREDGWVSGLLAVANFGGAGADGPLMMVSAQGIATLRVSGMGDVTAPHALHATVNATDVLGLDGRLSFEDEEEASAFVARWERIVRANSLHLRVVGLYHSFMEAQWEVDREDAIFRIRVPERTVRTLVRTVEVAMDARRR